LINVWSQGRKTFDTAAGVAKFALVGLGPSAMIGAVVGVGSLYLAADADWGNFVALGAAWWLRDAAGALGVAPVAALVGVRGFARLQSRQGLGLRRHHRRSECRGPYRLQSAHRAERDQERVGVPRGAAAVVGGAAVRRARHRDRRAHSLVLCRLGHVGGRRAVRGRDS